MPRPWSGCNHGRDNCLEGLAPSSAPVSCRRTNFTRVIVTKITLSAIGALVGICLVGPGAQARDVAIHAGALLDGVNDAPRHEVTIVVREERIISVTPGYSTPAGAEVIDL